VKTPKPGSEKAKEYGCVCRGPDSSGVVWKTIRQGINEPRGCPVHCPEDYYESH